MYTSPGIEPVIGRCENLRVELLAFFERVGAPVSDEMREFVETAAPRNTSAHGDWRGYYDAELADLVAERDATVIERFGYLFAE
jgi:ribosomal protein S16